MAATPSKSLLVAPDDAARADAARLAAGVDPSSELGATLREVLEGVANGERVVILRADRDVSPAVAAEILGVSRQFVDRLLADGVLAFHRLPGSTHRRIKTDDVLALVEERERRRQGADAIRAALG